MPHAVAAWTSVKWNDEVTSLRVFTYTNSLWSTQGESNSLCDMALLKPYAGNEFLVHWIAYEFCVMFLSQECKKTALFILLSDAVWSLNRWKQLDFNISVRICSLRVETYKVQLTKNLYHEIINFAWIYSFKKVSIKLIYNLKYLHFTKIKHK